MGCGEGHSEEGFGGGTGIHKEKGTLRCCKECFGSDHEKAVLSAVAAAWYRARELKQRALEVCGAIEHERGALRDRAPCDVILT